MNEQSKHTPGTWKVILTSFGHLIVEAHGDGAPKFIVDCGRRSSEQVKANARLIHAAPDLLEACKAMLHLHDPVATVAQSIKAMNQAKAAISKAQGE